MLRWLIAIGFVSTTFNSLAFAEEPLAPEAALKTFVHPDDVRVELVAAEPEVIDPVAVAFDPKGRMYVVENRGYPSGPPEGEGPAGKVALLEDSDGDGYYETRHEFADGFEFPNGVMLWRDGILVTDAPNIWYVRDTDGDNIADAREVFLTGFSPGASTQLRVSHPTLGLDNWLYFTNGLSGGEVTDPNNPDEAVVKMGGNDLRYQPWTGALETCGGQAQFGLTFDDFGHRFVCSNRRHIEHVVLEPKDLARNPNANLTDVVAQIPEHGEAAKIYPISENRTTAYSHAGTFTAACGLVIYRGHALPSNYHGNGFVCDPTGNLVHRDVLTPFGGTFVARRAQEEAEFLASTDNWSRPVFLTNGPDGALYLCDMYRFTIEHPRYLPPEIAAKTDFDSGKDRGRIYRITGADAPESGPAIQDAAFADQSAGALVNALAGDNAWRRDTARRLLLEQDNAEIADTVRQQTKASKVAAARAVGLSVLDGLGEMKQSDLADGMSDPDSRVRAFTAKLARRHDLATLIIHLRRLADDEDAAVRFAAALALGDAQELTPAATLAKIAAQLPEDQWTQSAALSGVAGSEVAFASAFLDQADLSNDAVSDVLHVHGRLVAANAPIEALSQYAIKLLQETTDETLAVRFAGLTGLAEGGAGNEALPPAESPLLRIAQTAPAQLLTPIEQAVSRATEVAAHSGAPRALRGQAIELLGHASYANAGSVLETIIGSTAEEPLQVAAVQALSKCSKGEIAAFLLDAARWPELLPAVRSAGVQALLANPERITALLDAIGAGTVPHFAVNPAQRGQLQKHRDASVQEKANAVFASAPGTDRMAVYEDFKPVLEMDGDPEAGAKIYAELCANCHVFKGQGHAVGPELSDLSIQPMASTLMHILVPNHEVVAGYENYVVETKDWESHTGILAAETDTAVTLRQALGVEQTIAREDIESITTSRLSLMPSGLEEGMTKQDLRNLLAFLRGEGEAKTTPDGK